MRVGAALLVVAAVAADAVAGWPCRGCRAGDTAAHAAFDGTGCGPRVFGPMREPVGPIDQCDGCARFQGCNGGRQMPDLLAPWQLPPGRGFRPPEAFGYAPGSCAECAACGGQSAWPRLW